MYDTCCGNYNKYSLSIRNFAYLQVYHGGKNIKKLTYSDKQSRLDHF